MAVARITKPHGIHGEVVIASLSGETEHLLSLTDISLRQTGTKDSRDRFIRVESIRRAHNRLLVKLRGVDTPEAAEALRGLEVWVSRKDAAPLGESEYYVADLVGCRVFLLHEESEPQEVGEVVGVIEGPTDDFLEVALDQGRGALVPLRGDYVGEVDLPGKRIEILEPEILE